MLDSVLPRTDDFAAVQVRKRLAELGLTSARGEAQSFGGAILKQPLKQPLFHIPSVSHWAPIGRVPGKDKSAEAWDGDEFSVTLRAKREKEWWAIKPATWSGSEKTSND